MPALRAGTTAGRHGWQALLEAPRSSMLAVDFDGTLAPIVANPLAARPTPQSLTALRALMNQLGTVAILTGRPAATATDLLGADRDDALRDLIVLGQYGLERWTRADGVTGSLDSASRIAISAVRQLLPDVVQLADGDRGVLVEDKGLALAVHTRNAVDPVASLRRLRGPLAHLADSHGLRLEPGRLVLELRPNGTDKGSALEALALERGATSVIYAGDDVGDLAAFDAVDRLRAHGVPGVLVCSGSDEVAELAARADVVVDGPAGIAALLAELSAAIRPG